MSQRIEYFKNLDGVRGIAALMVMVFHFFLALPTSQGAPSFLLKASGFGQTGVTLFFVLSGFLITRILIWSKQSKGYFGKFYWRRSLRIFPLYYSFLLIYYFALPHLLGNKQVPFNEQLYFYGYLQNFAETFNWQTMGPHHFWSLAVEEHFYLFWPLLVYLFNPRRLSYVIGILVLGALVLRYFMVKDGMEVFYFTFTRIDALALGSLLAIFELKNWFKPANSNKFLLLLVLVTLPTLFVWFSASGEGQSIVQVYKYLLIALLYFALLGLVLSLGNKHLVNKFLSNRMLLFTGKISYGLYVYHPLAYTICFRFIFNGYWLIGLMIGFVMAYAMATVSFYLIEKPFLRLKDRFNYKVIKE